MAEGCLRAAGVGRDDVARLAEGHFVERSAESCGRARMACARLSGQAHPASGDDRRSLTPDRTFRESHFVCGSGPPVEPQPEKLGGVPRHEDGLHPPAAVNLVSLEVQPARNLTEFVQGLSGHRERAVRARLDPWRVRVIEPLSVVDDLDVNLPRPRLHVDAGYVVPQKRLALALVESQRGERRHLIWRKHQRLWIDHPRQRREALVDQNLGHYRLLLRCESRVEFEARLGQQAFGHVPVEGAGVRQLGLRPEK